MFRVSVQSDYFVGGVCARRGQYLKGVMYLGGGGRARPAGEKVHPDRSTWPSGLANVRGLVTGTGGSRDQTSPGARHDRHVGLGTRTKGPPVVIPLLLCRHHTVQTPRCPSHPKQLRFQFLFSCSPYYYTLAHDPSPPYSAIHLLYVSMSTGYDLSSLAGKGLFSTL